MAWGMWLGVVAFSLEAVRGAVLRGLVWKVHCPFQYLQTVHPQDGPPLPVGEQLRGGEEPAVLRALHGEYRLPGWHRAAEAPASGGRLCPGLSCRSLVKMQCWPGVGGAARRWEGSP